MIKENEKAVFVIANYRFSDANQFCYELEHSESFKQKLQDFKKAEITSNIPLPANLPMPIAVYRNANNQILFSAGDARLEISSNNYIDESDNLKDLFFCLSQFKLQDILAAGINFSVNCNIGEKRLSIFNEKINDKNFSNWSKNTGFSVTLPIDLHDVYNCSAAYFISKVKGGKNAITGVFEPYIYNISVNYNFLINEDKADAVKRLDKLKLIENLTDSLYSDFNIKCEEITKL